MIQQNTIENLELKLAQIRKEKAEIAQKVEKDFKKQYSGFLQEIFGRDFLGVSRYFGSIFQLEKIDTPKKNDKEIFYTALKKSIDILPLSVEKKQLLSEKIKGLFEKKEFPQEKMVHHSELQKDIDYPIVESLLHAEVLSNEDIIHLSIAYEKTKNLLTSLTGLDAYKRDIIKKNFFALHSVSVEEKVKQFQTDFKEEIESSKLMRFYPKVIQFVGRNYSTLKLKNKIETKKQRLQRIFKIAFLKLYRLKYSGIDIQDILQKIDTIDDLDRLISLLVKFFEELRQNPALSSDYVVLDEIDAISDIVHEAELHKENTLLSDEKIIKASSLVEETENKLSEERLEKILHEETDLIGGIFVVREKPVEDTPQTQIDTGILAETNEDNHTEDDDIEEEQIGKDGINLQLRFKILKNKLFELEEKKKKLFLLGDYDAIDILNDELIELIKKLEKFQALIKEE